MNSSIKKRIIFILAATIVLSFLVFLSERMSSEDENLITRNSYGEGGKTEEYELTIKGEIENEPMDIVVEEQEYTHEEIQEIFKEVMEKLDEVVLGENESFDQVERNLHLVNELEGYPVQIRWELDSYSVLNIYGEIQEKNLVPQGTLVELRGTISYRDEQAIYIQCARVYPLTREGVDKLLYEIKQKIAELEEETRKDESFTLPTEINGVELDWSQKKTNSWCYILLMGVVMAVYLVYREREKVKQEKRRRKEELTRDYPGMVSKLTMLLSTGATMRYAWEKIVNNYEKQKEQMGVRIVFEEMAVTVSEMQSGVPEAEAYERFGRRCGTTIYMKFGMLLSQNLRKGSKGLSEILRMEAVQSFENRKSTAERLGEEAGTKLLMPMLGMLAVVFIMVMVPAFLTMQL